MTTITEATRLALQGMKNVEREIIDQARARQVAISEADFTWNMGAPLQPLPPIIHMEVRSAKGVRVVTEWLHIYFEDCCDRIERADVRQKITRTVDSLAPTP
jgi:hypothetical protein